MQRERARDLPASIKSVAAARAFSFGVCLRPRYYVQNLEPMLSIKGFTNDSVIMEHGLGFTNDSGIMEQGLILCLQIWEHYPLMGWPSGSLIWNSFR